MLTWDKIYLNIKEILDLKKKSAQTLWAITQNITVPSLKIVLLNLWRIEIHHALRLNKLLQNLGYAQIKLIGKDNIGSADILEAIEQNIGMREKWLPVLEKITAETFGNDIYYTFMGIMADDLVSIEVLKELKMKLNENQTNISLNQNKEYDQNLN